MPLKINRLLQYAFVPPIFLFMSIAIRSKYESYEDKLLIDLSRYLYYFCLYNKVMQIIDFFNFMNYLTIYQVCLII